MIAPYARRDAAWIAAVGAAGTLAVAIAWGAWGVLPALATLGLLAFYRDPVRTPPGDPTVLLAPADGRVMFVERRGPDADGGPVVLRIGIFLSVFDVHVNRSPCAAAVADVAYRPGRFLNALKGEATDRNECNTITLEPRPPLPGPVRVRQIAGMLARRIVCVLRRGDTLGAGERFGMIKLGSQTEICVPDDDRWEVRVQPGEHVRAGVTILARLRASET